MADPDEVSVWIGLDVGKEEHFADVLDDDGESLFGRSIRNDEAALEALDELERVWGAKYPAGIKSWRDHWDELATMFKYPEPIRRVIYTTNAIENFNRQLRKVTKTKSAFVSDDALLKQLYLVTMQVTESWTMPIKDWGQILMHLMIFFGDRVNVTL